MEQEQNADIYSVAVNLRDLPDSLEMKIAHIGNACYRDAKFKQLICSDPKTLIINMAKEFCEDQLPAEQKSRALKVVRSADDGEKSMRFVVRHNTDKKWHIPLPCRDLRKRIGDDEMKEISGGFALVTLMGLIGPPTAAVFLSSAVVIAAAAGAATAGVIGAIGGSIALAVRLKK